MEIDVSRETKLIVPAEEWAALMAEMEDLYEMISGLRATLERHGIDYEFEKITDEKGVHDGHVE
jgi:hypothetical protein